MNDCFGDFSMREAKIRAIKQSIISLIILLDTSGSMRGRRINEVNTVMSGLSDLIKNVEESYCVQVRLRVIQFDSVATWVLGDTEHYVCNYQFSGYDHAIESMAWIPLVTGGTTATAEAIALARSAVHNDFYPKNAPHILNNEFNRSYYYPSIILLITDGMSNDPSLTATAIEYLKRSAPQKYENQTSRIAIGIGGAGLDELKRFASVGKIEHGDGTKSETIPLAFFYEHYEEDMLGKNLKSIIRSAIVSSISYGRLDESENLEYLPVISEYHDAGDDWLDC